MPDSGEWREPTDDDRDDLRRALTQAQVGVLSNLLASMADRQVRVRLVEEFDGEIDAPVALEVVGGTRFVIYADGDVTEYQRDDQ